MCVCGASIDACDGQGVNFIYLFFGGLALYPRMCFTDEITPEMRALPQSRFMIMAFLDCLG